MKTPGISVIIPTLNAGECFSTTLQRILDQDVSLSFEIIVIDSGSRDETLGICSAFPVRLLHTGLFHHSRTRNWAIEQASGDYIVLTVQDAIPADANWLALLAAPLAHDERVAGCYGRQMPLLTHSRLVHRRHELLHGEAQRPIQELGGRDETMIPLSERQRLAQFDNVTSCIRRSVWEHVPLPDIRYGEDFAWAWQAVKQGYRIVYEPKATVWHSHQRGLGHEFRRAYLMGDALCRVFGSIYLEDAPQEQATLCQLAKWFVLSLQFAVRSMLSLDKNYVTKQQVSNLLERLPRLEHFEWAVKCSSLERALLPLNSQDDQSTGPVLDALWHAIERIPTNRLTGRALNHALRRFLRRMARREVAQGCTCPAVQAIASWRPSYSLGFLLQLIVGYLGLGLIRARGRNLVPLWLFGKLYETDPLKVWASIQQFAAGRLRYAEQTVYDTLSGFLAQDPQPQWEKRYVAQVWLYAILRGLGLILGEVSFDSQDQMAFRFIDRWLSAGII